MNVNKLCLSQIHRLLSRNRTEYRALSKFTSVPGHGQLPTSDPPKIKHVLCHSIISLFPFCCKIIWFVLNIISSERGERSCPQSKQQYECCIYKRHICGKALLLYNGYFTCLHNQFPSLLSNLCRFSRLL